MEENYVKEERKDSQASSICLLERKEKAIPRKQPHPSLPYPAALPLTVLEKVSPGTTPPSSRLV